MNLKNAKSRVMAEILNRGKGNPLTSGKDHLIIDLAHWALPEGESSRIDIICSALNSLRDEGAVEFKGILDPSKNRIPSLGRIAPTRKGIEEYGDRRLLAELDGDEDSSVPDLRQQVLALLSEQPTGHFKSEGQPLPEALPVALGQEPTPELVQEVATLLMVLEAEGLVGLETHGNAYKSREAMLEESLVTPPAPEQPDASPPVPEAPDAKTGTSPARFRIQNLGQYNEATQLKWIIAELRRLADPETGLARVSLSGLLREMDVNVEQINRLLKRLGLVSSVEPRRSLWKIDLETEITPELLTAKKTDPAPAQEAPTAAPADEATLSESPAAEEVSSPSLPGFDQPTLDVLLPLLTLLNENPGAVRRTLGGLSTSADSMERIVNVLSSLVHAVAGEAVRVHSLADDLYRHSREQHAMLEAEQSASRQAKQSLEEAGDVIRAVLQRAFGTRNEALLGLAQARQTLTREEAPRNKEYERALSALENAIKRLHAKWRELTDRQGRVNAGLTALGIQMSSIEPPLPEAVIVVLQDMRLLPYSDEQQ